MDITTQNEIEKNVNKLMKDIGYKDNSREIDIIKIAKKLGFSIINAKMNNGDDGFVIVEDGVREIMGIKTDKLIGVNVDRSPQWKRFIIAHEIAHYMMNESDGLFAHREHEKGKNEEENKADFYAANLLMPRDKFTKSYNLLKEKEVEEKVKYSILASEYMVTEIMIKRRIKELELNA